MDESTLTPLLLGAALALLGGMITQFIFWRVSLAHTKDALLSSFRAELKNIRGSLGASIDGFRRSLRIDDPPTPTVFKFSTPVFSANAGHLGQLRDADLVEHIVEVYSSLHSLGDHVGQFREVVNETIDLKDMNSIHMDATTVHVQVMTLHNRLTNTHPIGKATVDDIEIESRELFAVHAKHLEANEISILLSKEWKEDQL